ncbi:hypothetical protein MMC29_000779, partial [Sticta canariensis]|nr:hypothetical protein [Sticta canariensis]
LLGRVDKAGEERLDDPAEDYKYGKTRRQEDKMSESPKIARGAGEKKPKGKQLGTRIDRSKEDRQAD